MRGMEKERKGKGTRQKKKALYLDCSGDVWKNCERVVEEFWGSCEGILEEFWRSYERGVFRGEVEEVCRRSGGVMEQLY